MMFVMLALAMLACTFGFEPPTVIPTAAPSNPSGGASNPTGGETATVTRVIDGDTIEVDIGGVGYRVRYVGVNTPERDEVCYQDATNANAAMVQGQTIRMMRDQSNTDRYGRLLRYIYVGDRFVNAELVSGGWAEAVEYRPDTLHTAAFRALEVTARSQNVGCHPTGIFNDGSDTR
jgi:micrococcal nuclease